MFFKKFKCYIKIYFLCSFQKKVVENLGFLLGPSKWSNPFLGAKWKSCHSHANLFQFPFDLVQTRALSCAALFPQPLLFIYSCKSHMLTDTGCHFKIISQNTEIESIWTITCAREELRAPWENRCFLWSTLCSFCNMCPLFIDLLRKKINILMDDFFFQFTCAHFQETQEYIYSLERWLASA